MVSTLLITVDALRATRLRQYGAKRNPMPVVDQLLTDGTKFTAAFANGPYTAFSIPSIHTSRYLGREHVGASPTIASTLGESGVQTAVIGTKTGFKNIDDDLGFDEFVDFGRGRIGDEANKKTLPERALRKLGRSVIDGYDRYEILSQNGKLGLRGRVRKTLLSHSYIHAGYHSAEDVTDEAIEWLNSNADSDFFLWLHYMEGHRPYGVHHDDYKYLDESLDQERIIHLSKKAGTDPSSLNVTEHRLLQDLYDSNLAYCSRHIARLFEALRTEGIWETTNVCFTSDHGEEFFDHGMYFHRNLPYDELLQVPLVLKTTAEQRAIIEEQRELLDLAPTICAEHGIDVSRLPFEGQHLLEGEERRVTALGCGHLPTEATVVAVRDDGWKYIYAEGDEYLFDISDDEVEVHDVADTHEKLVGEIRDEVPDEFFESESNLGHWEVENQVDKERLEALGYLELKEE